MRLAARVFLLIVSVGASVSLLGCAGEPSSGQAYLATALLATALSDQDMDGVIDGRDNCPATPNTLMVDSDGCKLLLPQVDHYQLAIKFRHGSGYLHPKFYPEISRLASRLQSNGKLSLLLEGYASRSGDSSVNYKLSLRRARVIAQRLIKGHDIAADRITVMGRGTSHSSIRHQNELLQGYENRLVEASLTQLITQQRRHW